MTSQTLRRQIDRAKSELDVIKPKPPTTIKVLCEPDPALGGDSLLDFLLEVREAKKTHDMVFVACFKWDDERVSQAVNGVQYFSSDFSAQCTRLTFVASVDGNKSAMVDIFKNLHGNVFTPGPLGGLPLGNSQMQ